MAALDIELRDGLGIQRMDYDVWDQFGDASVPELSRSSFSFSTSPSVSNSSLPSPTISSASSHEVASPGMEVYGFEDMGISDYDVHIDMSMGLQDRNDNHIDQEHLALADVVVSDGTSSLFNLSHITGVEVGQESGVESKTISKPGSVLVNKKSTGTRKPRDIKCFNCGVDKTPLWRRTPDRKHSLCNACGLYYKQYNQHRPLNIRSKRNLVNENPSLENATLTTEQMQAQVLAYVKQQKRKTESAMDEALEVSTGDVKRPKSEPTSPVLLSASEGHASDESPSTQCANCAQTQTPLWRKDDKGQSICNACGLYARLHQRQRPVAMRKTGIQRRRRGAAEGEDESQLDQSEGDETSADGVPMLSTLAGLNANLATALQNLRSGNSLVIPHDQPASNPLLSFLLQNALQKQMANTSSEADSSTDSTPHIHPEPVSEPARIRTPSLTIPNNTENDTVKGLANQFDDIRFRQLIAGMSRDQLLAFLGMLERRCDIIRHALAQDDHTPAGLGDWVREDAVEC